MSPPLRAAKVMVTCARRRQKSGASWRQREELFRFGARRRRAAQKNGLALFLVGAAASGVATRGYDTVDGQRAAEVTLSGVSVGADAVIGEPGAAFNPIERIAHVAMAALAAEAVGAMAAMQETTVDYLKARKQFGVTIGSFQALQHRAADMLVALEQVPSMALFATMMADEKDIRERRAAISAAKDPRAIPAAWSASRQFNSTAELA